MKNSVYSKYTYWVKPDNVKSLTAWFKSQGKRLKWARGVVCTPLDGINSASLVPPKAWEETCDRQGSWYRTSAHAGDFLLVSSEPVDHDALIPNTTITLSDFKPSSIAKEEHLHKLLNLPEYKRRVPAEWGDMDPRERKRWKVMLDKVGLDIDIDDLLRIHSANHANFMRPLFSVLRNGDIAPYSIETSDKLCSCCLEMYNIIGEKYPTKLVRPCLGALFFARLERNRYYEVKNAASDNG